MSDQDIFELAILEGIAWHDIEAMTDFFIGFRSAEDIDTRLAPLV